MNESCLPMPLTPLYLPLSAKSALEIWKVARSPPLESSPRLPGAKFRLTPLGSPRNLWLCSKVHFSPADCDLLKDRVCASQALHLWGLASGTGQV